MRSVKARSRHPHRRALHEPVSTLPTLESRVKRTDRLLTASGRSSRADPCRAPWLAGTRRRLAVVTASGSDSRISTGGSSLARGCAGEAFTSNDRRLRCARRSGPERGRPGGFRCRGSRCRARSGCRRLVASDEVLPLSLTRSRPSAGRTTRRARPTWWDGVQSCRRRRPYAERLASRS
jgi:hypothetical protein